MRFKSLPLITCMLCMLFVTLAPLKSANANIIRNYFYDISFVRNIEGKDGDFSIRLSSPESMTGCYAVEPVTYEVMDVGNLLYVKLQQGAEIYMQGKPSYGHGECKINSGNFHMDIPFNASTLIEKSTKKIHIQVVNVGTIFEIDIQPDDSKLTLHSKFKASINIPDFQKETQYHYWYYPENTVILKTHELDKDVKNIEKLKTFAQSRGLTPMHEALDGFPVPGSDNTALFYVDDKNTLKDIIDEKRPVVIGNISQAEEYIGAQGPYERQIKASIFARTLRMHD